jgi:hypothetical protein
MGEGGERTNLKKSMLSWGTPIPTGFNQFSKRKGVSASREGVR